MTDKHLAKYKISNLKYLIKNEEFLLNYNTDKLDIFLT